MASICSPPDTTVLDYDEHLNLSYSEINIKSSVFTSGGFCGKLGEYYYQKEIQMQTKLTKLPKAHAKMTVSLSEDELKKYFDRAYEKIGLSLKVDGFRPGKAPKALVEQAAGHTRIIQEAIDLALEESYPLALNQEKLYPVNQPKITIDLTPTISSGGDLEYTVEFDYVPEVSLGDYSKIKVKKPTTREAGEKDVDKVVEYLRKQKATFKEVDRTAKKGDRLEINFTGTVKGVAREGMSSKNHPIIIGDNVMIPGFEDELVGLKKGDKKKFKIKFPKDYHSQDLANQEAEFEVEVVDLKEIVLPEIDNGLASTFGHKDVSAMREAIKKSLQKEMDEKTRQELEMAVLDKVLPLMKAEIPESLVEQETDRMINNFRQQVESQGLTFDRYLISIKKELSDLRKDMRAQAEKNVKVGFLLGEIIKEQKLDTKGKDSGRKAVDYLVKTLVK